MKENHFSNSFIFIAIVRFISSDGVTLGLTLSGCEFKSFRSRVFFSSDKKINKSHFPLHTGENEYLATNDSMVFVSGEKHFCNVLSSI